MNLLHTVEWDMEKNAFYVCDVGKYLKSHLKKKLPKFNAFYADPPYGVTGMPWDKFTLGSAVNRRTFMQEYATHSLKVAVPGAISAVYTPFSLLSEWCDAFASAEHEGLSWTAQCVPLICVDNSSQKTFRPKGWYFDYKCVTEVVQLFVVVGESMQQVNAGHMPLER